jgi:hypothetical protein
MGDMRRIDEFQYVIDADNCIVDVDLQWLAFARANDADSLGKDAVIGEYLIKYIAGWETADFYSKIYKVLRKTGKELTLPFRCDSPDVRRYMELRLIPLEDGCIQHIGRLLRREQRKYVPLLDPGLGRTGDYQKICSICRKIMTDNGQWEEIEEALDEPYSVPFSGLRRLSHTLCPCWIHTMYRLLEEGGATTDC